MASERRILKLNKTLMKEISEVIMTEMKDPRLLSMITVLDASLSTDMRHLKVVVSLYGKNEMENLKTFEALNNASGFISSIVSKSLRMRIAPSIKFERSHSIENSINISNKLKEIFQKEGIDKDEWLWFKKFI